MKNDNVKHPSHYVEGRKFEPKDVIRDWDLNFNLGNAVKYLARAGRKADIVLDLKKAQQYIQFEIDALSPTPTEEKAPKETPNHNCKRGVNPIFANMENGKGVCAVSVGVPAGTPPEDVIKMIIEDICGGE